MKPGDFLIGVFDFFAILLPGSMATWLVTRYIRPDDLSRYLSAGHGGAPPDNTALWAAFLLASYVLGHFVFMIGARLDTSYDRWRRRTKPTNSDRTFKAAEDLRRRTTQSLVGSEFTVYKWCKSYIQVNAPNARTEIDRYEADSKFFRSLVIVSVPIALHFLIVEAAPLIAVGFLILGGAAYYRFREQRWKMTELCYGTAVILAAGKATTTSGVDVAQQVPD